MHHPCKASLLRCPIIASQGSLCRDIVPLADRLCNPLEVSTLLLVKSDSRANENGIILLIISFSYNICLLVYSCWLVAYLVSLVLFPTGGHIITILSANSVAA